MTNNSFGTVRHFINTMVYRTCLGLTTGYLDSPYPTTDVSVWLGNSAKATNNFNTDLTESCSTLLMPSSPENSEKINYDQFLGDLSQFWLYPD